MNAIRVCAPVAGLLFEEARQYTITLFVYAASNSAQVELPYDKITIGNPPLLYVPSPAKNLLTSPVVGAGTSPDVPAAELVAPVITE
jgi:hypothetical protein